MFKLFKDLTRPPERLDQPTSPSPAQSSTAPPSAPPSVGYVARQRTRPLPDQANGTPTKAGAGGSKAVEEVEETEEDAKKVVELLKGLEAAQELMTIVELFSQLLLIKPRMESLRAFRRHRGFSTIMNTLGSRLAWKMDQDTNDGEKQVAEVQMIEGIRLAFEVLAWAMQDRKSALFFEKEGGYMKLLPILRKLGPPQASMPDMTASSSSDLSHQAQSQVLPDAKILSYLLAHIFDNNYSLLSIFDTPPEDAPPLADRLGELKLRWGGALPLLWAYMWGQNIPSDSKKGKEKARDTDRLFKEVISGRQENLNQDHTRLIETTFKLLLSSTQGTTNLFILSSKLDLLSEFLINRLYGPAKKRIYADTFPAGRDWVDRDDDEEDQQPAWKAPSTSLRDTYLSLLRRLLETGVNQKITWRLFELVKTTEADRRKKDEHQEEKTHSGTSTPTGTAPPTPTKSRAGTEESTLTMKKKRPQLTLAPTTPLPVANMERLDAEVLDLLRHAMRSRWPDMFVFRGGRGISEAGIELPDLGRAWPGAQKGFHFSTWIHINRLNRPFTLLHVTQAGRDVLQISVLDNSQISIKSNAVSSDTATPVPEEVVCSAPDALIPHQTWVHFAINSRKPKSAESAEARLFINGIRVGTVKITYPTAIPLAPVSARTASSPDAIKVCVGRRSSEIPSKAEEGQEGGGKEDDNEIMLGRTLLLEETISEDSVLLLHHLGPRYHGNFQEAAGRFLTYEGATSINIYLSTLGQNATDKRLFTLPNTSAIVKAIRTGPAIAEEHILLSLSASDIQSSEESLVNAAVPHPWRAKQLRHGLAKLHGDVYAFSPIPLDDSVEAVGGGAVVLKLVDLSQTPEELASALSILRDLIKDSWRASEEMERIYGFDLLAAILRPKMPLLVDISCTKIILQMLGINMDKPETATVHNSVAYRALGVEFELWSHAALGVTSLYLEHFQYLLIDSKHRRFNLLRTFQKSAMIRKLLYALRSGLFDAAVVPVVVDTLKVALEVRWSGEDSIKPVFSYLVTALCQNTQNVLPLEPPPSQAPAAYVLTMFAEVAQDATRLIKLNKAIALHRLLVVFISSNPAYYVVIPSLEMLEQCLSTPGLENFHRSFETEGGFALLAKTLPGIWRDDVQGYVFRMMLGKDVSEDGKGSVKCPGLLSCVLGALDVLLQQAGDDESGGSGRPTQARTRSGTVTSIRSIAFSPIQPTSTAESDDERLQDLLSELASTYRSSHPFRRSFTTRKIEGVLPALTDFAAISASSSKEETVRPQREAAADFVQAILDHGKLSGTLNSQLKLIQEQLQTANPNTITRPLSASMISSPMAINAPSPARASSSYFSSSLSSRFGTTPPSSIPSSPTGSIRRRPSMEAGQTFNRARSIIERRAPLKRVLTNESVLEGGKDKNAAWKLIIIQTDSQRHSKMTLERKEHWNKLGEQDWPRLAQSLRSENGLWPEEDAPVTWRLDGSEGPLRMRARLERVNALPDVGMAKTQRKLRDAIPSVDELSSAVSRVNVAPWEDPFALALGQAAPIEEEDAMSAMAPTKAAEPADAPEDRVDGDSFVEVEEEKDDKMRRIAKTLEAGDVVEEAHNIIRIVGVDACPGLLIIGKKNLYLIDGLVQTPNGEVIDAKDAPKDVLTVPSGTLVELDSTDQQSRRWSYNEIVESNKRMFLFRDVALELYFSDKRNFLIVFRDKRQRQIFMSRLLSKNDPRDAISKSIIGNFVLDTVARAIDKSEQQLEAMTRRWQSREISNFAYLQLLNQHANRTPNDVTQYPVFPWVLADYTSFNLDLEKDTTFRNLALPMGALTAARQESATERYSATEGVGEKPFHYGTHYSSSMIVCGYMIRASPFTEIFLALQGGNFDLADRLFSSIPRAWVSASSENRGDVRELVPEFYYSPSFLINVNHHDFGKKQVSGDSVNDVVLPPWALDEPSLFIHRHREALESDYVSRHLPHWIDLVFGAKQRDPASFNCYHPLSYRGAVDLESIKDESEKAASTAIIHNFGQTPEQIFKAPHPHRFLSGKNTLPVGQRFGVAEGWQLLLRSILPITESATPIDDLVELPPGSDAKPAPRQKFRLDVPGTYVTVQFGFADESLRVYHQDPTTVFPRLVHLTEGIDARRAIFAAPYLLITVSTDSVLTAWRMQIKNQGFRRGDVQLTREATLRGHTSKVTCLAASASWSLLVSGTEDGNAIVWDTNRLRYTRLLQTTRSDPIKFCQVHEADGKIALVTARDIYLFSLNGHPIAHTSLANSLSSFNFTQTSIDHVPDEFTGNLTFLNREFLKFGPLFVIGVGPQLALYRCVPGVQIFEDEEVKPWTLEEQGRLNRSEDHNGGDCTMVKFIGETLYAAFAAKVGGNTKSTLYQWSLPEGNARHVPEMVSGTCMTASCGRHFGLLEPRRHCGGCGGAFCGTHAVHVENFQSRYCESCRSHLVRGATLGLLAQRRDSVISASASSRRGSLAFSNPSTSRPGSRRGSILVPPHLAGIYTKQMPHGPSGLGSRPGSRRGSFSKPGSGHGSGSATPMLH